MDLAQKQIEFGRLSKHRLTNMTKSKAGDTYCAFYDVEYNEGLDDAKIPEAKEEIKISLENLLQSDLIKNIARRNCYNITQRQIGYDFAGMKIRCTPDLIVFFKDEPPWIIDWKVHAFANVDYKIQLGIYGVALSKTNPHRDFPTDFCREPDKMELLEYQLLKNDQRDHSLDADNILEVEDYIFHSIMQIKREMEDKAKDELDVNKLRTAISPNVCEKCQFKKLCWEETRTQGSLFEVL